MDFNRNSTDAMFSLILERIESYNKEVTRRLDGQDQFLIRIENQTTKTNGRVSLVEAQRAVEKAVSRRTIAIISGCSSAAGLGIGWALEIALAHIK